MNLALMAITESYEDVRLLIYSTIHRFIRSYGGDFEDLLSDANEFYMLAYRTWDRNKGPFPSWVRFQVWTELLERVRRNTSKNNRLPRLYADITTMEHKRRFSLEDFTFDLSADAAEVVKWITLNPPKGPSKLCIVRKHLNQQGWSGERIDEVFEEITEALR